jgi:hypothetical protein
VPVTDLVVLCAPVNSGRFQLYVRPTQGRIAPSLCPVSLARINISLIRQSTCPAALSSGWYWASVMTGLLEFRSLGNRYPFNGL